MRNRDSTFRICCKSVHFIEYFSIICHTNIGILFELSIRQVNNSANSAPHNQARCSNLWVVNPGHCVTKIEIELHISTIVVVAYRILITLLPVFTATLLIIFSPPAASFRRSLSFPILLISYMRSRVSVKLRFIRYAPLYYIHILIYARTRDFKNIANLIA